MLKMMRAASAKTSRPEYVAPLCARKWDSIARDVAGQKQPASEAIAAGRHVLIRRRRGLRPSALGVALAGLASLAIVEKKRRLGGTWYVNRYRGCASITPNHFLLVLVGARIQLETRYFAQRDELLTIFKRSPRRHDVCSQHPLQHPTDVVALGQTRRPLDLDMESPNQGRGRIRVGGPGRAIAANDPSRLISRASRILAG